MSDPDDPELEAFDPTQPIDLAKTNAPAVSEPTRPVRRAAINLSRHRRESTEPIDLAKVRAAYARSEPTRPVDLPGASASPEHFEPTKPFDLAETRAALARPEPTRPIDPIDAGPSLEQGEPAHLTELLETRPSSGPGPAIAGFVVAALLAGAVGWYLLRPAPPTPLPPPSPPHALAESPPAAALPARSAAAPIPPLGASDAYVRELALRLGANPQLARWLAGDELARRFVAIVLNVAEGTSPANHLRELQPSRPFEARASRGRWFVTAASFQRYDRIVGLINSLDPQAVATLFGELHPLLDLAYAEIGNPASSFDATLSEALGTLLRVPISDGPMEVRPRGVGVGFDFVDRSLEERTVAEKHLLRFGPENARRVQAKLAALAAACGIQPR